jgi:hypothetical protein
MKMNKSALALTLALSISACSSSPPLTNVTQEPRYKIANELSAKKQYAQSLHQWQILQLRYPNNNDVKNGMIEVKQQIEDEKKKLLNDLALAKRSNKKDSKQHENILIRLLALNPNDNKIKESLRAMRWETELANANKKTSLLRRSFVENDKAAKQEIALSSILKRAKEASKKQDFEVLLTLMNELEALKSDHKLINDYRLNAYLGLAEKSVKSENTVEALQYFQTAKNYASGKKQRAIQSTIKELRETEANALFNEAQKIFKQDIVKAIVLLEQAVTIDPSNARAKRLLLNAQRIQANLERIKQGQ